MSYHATIPLSQAQRPFFAGVDVGGTNIKFGVVDNAGHSLGKSSIPTLTEEGPAAAMDRAAAGLARLLGDLKLSFSDLSGVGLGTPGTMNIAAGQLMEPPNLPGWWHFPIRDYLAQATGRPVTFANDANAAAFGEWWAGTGREYHSIVMFTLGTGIGGGIIIGDLSVDGENSHGSELGHIIIDWSEQARLCPCGHTGHLEAYCSATSLVKRAAEALAGGHKSSLAACEEKGERITPLLMAREAEAGDSLALELILETAMFLGVGVVSMMHTIDPGAVILGGAMNFGGHETELGRRFLERVRQEVKARAFHIPAERTVVDYATLGGDAGYIGAAGLARAAAQKKKV